MKRLTIVRSRLLFALTIGLLMAFASFASLRIGSALAADPTPQGVTGYINQQLFSYNGVTSTAAGNSTGLAVLSPGYALGDCYNNISYQGGLVNTATVKVQSSADGLNWVDTQAFTDITNTTEMSRVVLYGYYARATVTSIFTSANPITGSVLCTFKNLR